MRVLNPPGGKSNISFNEDESSETNPRPAPTAVVNKCQQQRMQSHVFNPQSCSEIEANKRDFRASEKVAGVRSASNLDAVGTIYSNGTIPHRKHSQFASRNNQSHIFD